MRVDAGELGVVVEHLLEVRDEPDRVGRVAVEAAAELVVDPAVGHRIETAPRDGERTRVPGRGRAPEEVLDRHRLGELGSASPPAVRGIEARLDRGRRRVEECPRRRVAGRRAGLLLDERVDEPRAGREDLEWLVAPGSGDPGENLAERRHPVGRLRREVGPAVERLAVGREEEAHRPAALAGHRLDRGHVDLVQVRSLLAVDLHRDEVPVQVLGRGRVLEALALHDVAPVAGRVADAQEDRLVLSRARSSASGPHGYQSTGLCACWSR